MLGEEANAAVESFLLPDLVDAGPTAAAEVPIDGDRRIRKRCGSSAEASMMVRGRSTDDEEMAGPVRKVAMQSGVERASLKSTPHAGLYKGIRCVETMAIR